MDADVVGDGSGRPMRPQRPRGMLGLRVAILVLGAIFGAVLLARGRVLLGGLVLAMVVLRAVLIARMHRFRQERVAYREERLAQRGRRQP